MKKEDKKLWVCNECNSKEYTASISEEDVHKLQCSTCGGNEFHLALNKKIDVLTLEKLYYEAVGRGDLQNETDMIDIDSLRLSRLSNILKLIEPQELRSYYSRLCTSL